MLLTDARRLARTTVEGELVPLAQQDRALWDREQIAEGVALLSASLPKGSIGPYQLQAAIAAVHDEAARPEDTDWPQILALYELLKCMSENPMVMLNHAIAAAMVHGPSKGLELLESLDSHPRLAGHHRLDAVRAHLLGNWYVPGDFNPAPAVPVWPFLEWILFFFTGVNIEAARGLAVAFFFVNLVLTYTLIRSNRPRWTALLALTLIVTSPFLYCFSRLAILEPMLTALMLAAMGEQAPEEVARALDTLTAKQLIYRVRTSSMAGDREYAFGHCLAREVAYAELPRLVRAKKHRAVAAWVEATAGDPGELVEILAHHHLSALELARDAGDAGLEAELLPPTIDCLARASTRVLAVDVQAAERYCSRAMALTGERPSELLCAWARVLSLTERHRESLAVWKEAVDRLRAEGKSGRAAAAMCEMGFEYETFGIPFKPLVEEAFDLVRDEGFSVELATVLTASLIGEWEAKEKTAEEVITGADQILAMCRDRRLPLPPYAFMYKAMARFALGDEGCMEDLTRGLEVAEAQGLAIKEESIRYNFAMCTMEFKGAAASLDATLRGLETAKRRGDRTFVRVYEAALVDRRYFTGEWDQALEGAQAIEARLLEAEDYFDLVVLKGGRVMMLTSRGLIDEAEPHAHWLSEHALQMPEQWPPARARVALIEWQSARGQWGEVRQLLHSLREARVSLFTEFCPTVVRCALSAQERDWAQQLVDDIGSQTPLREHVRVTGRAVLDEAGGQHEAASAGYSDAAARWHDFGVPYEEAQALLGQGRCLVELGRAEEAREPLTGASEIFDRLGARPALAETEKLLAGLASSSQV